MRQFIKAKKVLPLLLIVLLLLASFSPALLRKVDAGTFDHAKVTISNSQASATSVTYDFAFTTSVTTAIKQINFKFCTEVGQFTETCTAPTGFTAASATRDSDNIAGTGRTDTPVAGTFQTVVTTPATQSTQAVTFVIAGVTNPSTADTSFYVRFRTYSDAGTTMIDNGQIMFAILSSTSIAVTAVVDPTFTFTVTGKTSGTTVNTATSNITTEAATIPFGTLADAAPKIGAHDVTIATNATFGYTVTVKALADPPLVDGNNNIDKFTGTNTTPTTWTSPAGTAASVNTGFFGYTTEDTTLSQFQANKWAGATTSPLNIMSEATAVSGGEETVRIGWQAEVNESQPAGSYTGTVILVATPTY